MCFPVFIAKFKKHEKEKDAFFYFNFQKNNINMFNIK